MHKFSLYRATSQPLPPMEARDSLFPEEETANLRDYWIIILKYRWTIATFLLSIVFITGFFSFRTEPVYIATAILRIEVQLPNIMMGSPDMLAPGDRSLDFYYKTQLNLLQSRSLAAQVIQDLDLARDPRFGTSAEGPLSGVQSSVRQGIGAVARWIQARFKAVGAEEASRRVTENRGETFELGVPPKLIDRYLKRVRVSHVEESQLVKVSFSSSDPALSMGVANAHMTTFISRNLVPRFELTAEGRQYFEEKLTELKAKLVKSEENLNRFRSTHPVVALEHGESLVMERLKSLNGDLTQARSRRIDLEALYRAVQQRDNRFLSQIIDNPVLQQMKNQITALETEQARLATVFQPTHPKVITLQEQINQAKKHLDQEVQRIIHSIISDYAAAKAKEAALTAEMEQQRQTALDLREKALEVAVLERDVESNRVLYENVLKRTKEADLSGAVPISNIRVVDRADMPLQPSTHAKRDLLLSVCIGLLGGIGLAFVLHHLDSTLKTPEDIERFLRLPTLGVVPDIRRLDRQVYGAGNAKRISLLHRPFRGHKGEQRGLVISLHPLSLISACYQTLYTALLFSLPERPPRTIVITSAKPQEGKTVTAINLAVTLARNGSPVLLIDADLRNGRCHKLLGVQNGRGLTNVLTGNGSATECIKKTSIPNLSLLSRGELPPNPMALLGSETMRQMLQSLETDFPCVILDSAPLLPITDTVLLSTKVDGVLVVAKAQEASRYVVRQACERLAYVKAPVLGVVLNNIDIRSPEYKEYRGANVEYYTAYATDAPSDSLAKATDDPRPEARSLWARARRRSTD